MTNILIIGATGNVGSATRQALLAGTTAQLTLFSRHANELSVDANRERVIAGDVLSDTALSTAIKGQDVVFVALSGAVEQFAQRIIATMNQEKVQRLIFITSMGIYNEVPTAISDYNLKTQPILKVYRQAADLIEASQLDYTIIRPGWFTDGPVNYEVTTKSPRSHSHLGDTMSRLQALRTSSGG